MTRGAFTPPTPGYLISKKPRLVSVKMGRLNHFRTGVRQVFTSQKPLPSEIRLTIESETSNSI